MRKIFLVIVVLSLNITPSWLKAEDDHSDLAQQSQNPIANLISLPLQNNLTATTGPENGVQNILNIQPVLPVSIGPLNLINRIILPLVSQPAVVPGGNGAFGLGDINYQLYFSPSKPSKLVWGIGPIVNFPSGTDPLTGSGKLSLGPTAVALAVTGPWVGGLLINNVWSVAGDNTRAGVNQMLMQPFVNYNLPKGWFLTSAPILTANWNQPNDNRWVAPVGGGGGRVFKIGSQPVNLSSQFFFNAIRPKGYGEFTWRLQIVFLFPKKG